MKILYVKKSSKIKTSLSNNQKSQPQNWIDLYTNVCCIFKDVVRSKDGLMTETRLPRDSISAKPYVDVALGP